MRPGAQLRSWGLPHKGYDGNEGRAARQAIIAGLRRRTSLPPSLQRIALESADAVDAIVCALTAMAVTAGELRDPPPRMRSDEGWIAVAA
jgi:hypothetical protein